MKSISKEVTIEAAAAGAAAALPPELGDCVKWLEQEMIMWY